MGRRLITSLVVLLVLALPRLAGAQGAGVAPTLIPVTGTLRTAEGQPRSGVPVSLIISLYDRQDEATPRWVEQQQVTLDAGGAYSVQFGATLPEGLPADLFTDGAGARWLGIAVQGETEEPRVMLTSLPYAARAASASTLDGRSASEFVLTSTFREDLRTVLEEEGVGKGDVSAAGTPNFLAKFLDPLNISDSAIFNDGLFVGVNTTAPLGNLHVIGNGAAAVARFENSNPAAGAAMEFVNGAGRVWRFKTTTTSKFGIRDHTAGVDRVTIDLAGNVGVGTVDPLSRLHVVGDTRVDGLFSVNHGGFSPLFVRNGGNVGIGTTTPNANLEVTNPNTASTYIAATSYANNGFGSVFSGRKARGTAAAPTAVLSNDALVQIEGIGYATTRFSSSWSAIALRAAENWTDTAQGTRMSFTTTPVGSTQPLERMNINPNGNIGIGTFSAVTNLEVSNVGTLSTNTGIAVTNYGNHSVGSYLSGRKARGTASVPASVQAGDGLAVINAVGYGTTRFSNLFPSITVRAAENFTDTAQGTRIDLATVPFGQSFSQTRMTISPLGDIGIGTTAPSEAVEVVRSGEQGAGVVATTYGAEETNGGTFFMARNARGTAVAPTAVQQGDALGYFVGAGRGTSAFSDEFAGGMVVVAAEDWTDTAQGAAMAFITTPVGSTEGAGSLVVMPDGKVGIGTFFEIPTIADRLQVFGDIRVGTAGTNGCLKNFDGTGLIGVCSSDGRLKRDIAPFGSVLGPLASLQPVHYFWRSGEYPDRHFGNQRAYGLIAQEVEAVLPELVVTDADGFKAVDYSKLPLLTIQAVKELKAENEQNEDAVKALKAENEALKQRLADLERLVEGLAANRR